MASVLLLIFGVMSLFCCSISIPLKDDKCLPGFHVPEDICVPCRSGTYNSREGRAISCAPCSSRCKSQRFAHKVSECNSTHDMRCECDPGYFSRTEQSQCIQHADCSSGFVVKTPGTPWSNTVCESINITTEIVTTNPVGTTKEVDSSPISKTNVIPATSSYEAPNWTVPPDILTSDSVASDVYLTSSSMPNKPIDETTINVSSSAAVYYLYWMQWILIAIVVLGIIFGAISALRYLAYKKFCWRTPPPLSLADSTSASRRDSTSASRRDSTSASRRDSTLASRQNSIYAVYDTIESETRIARQDNSPFLSPSTYIKYAPVETFVPIGNGPFSSDLQPLLSPNRCCESVGDLHLRSENLDVEKVVKSEGNSHSCQDSTLVNFFHSSHGSQ